MQIQGSTIKKFKPKESNTKNSKPVNRKTPALLRINKSKKTFYQDKKKEYFKKKRAQKNSILTIKDNTIKGEKKRNN